MEAPNPKHQIFKLFSIAKNRNKAFLACLKLEFGAYLGFGICNL
jgi:hypothetical protein